MRGHKFEFCFGNLNFFFLKFHLLPFSLISFFSYLSLCFPVCVVRRFLCLFLPHTAYLSPFSCLRVELTSLFSFSILLLPFSAYSVYVCLVHFIFNLVRSCHDFPVFLLLSSLCACLSVSVCQSSHVSGYVLHPPISEFACVYLLSSAGLSILTLSCRSLP